LKVILTRKLADAMDGIDVSACRVADILELSESDARCLVAEEWATPERRSSRGSARDVDRRTWRPSREHSVTSQMHENASDRDEWATSSGDARKRVIQKIDDVLSEFNRVWQAIEVGEEREHRSHVERRRPERRNGSDRRE
jgi:hypothetical protein